MKAKISTLILLSLLLAQACHDEPSLVYDFYYWTPSNLSSPYNGFSKFATGDDGQLYCAGFIEGKYGIHRAKADGWETIAEFSVQDYWVQDFVFFKESAYIITAEGEQGFLWRARNSTVEKVFDDITGLALFKNKLVIVRKFTDAIGTSFKLAQSVDGSTFNDIILETGNIENPPIGCCVYLISNRLFLFDKLGDTFEFDGAKFFKTLLPKFQFFQLIDDNSFYNITTKSDRIQTIEKNNHGIIEQFSEGLSSENDLIYLRSSFNTLIAIGYKNEKRLSVAYSFQNNKWIEIPTTNYFAGIFEYQQKLFAFTFEGTILELVKQ